MPDTHILVGTPQRRVDGRAKVTGAATYAGEFSTPGLLHGYVVSSSIARGRIAGVDATAALAVPGVVQVFTHENRPKTAYLDHNWQDQVGPPGHTFRPLYDEIIHYSGQPVALVVAESFDLARHAAGLVRVAYDTEAHETNLEAVRGDAYDPPKKRSGINPPPKPRGNAAAALKESHSRVENEWTIAPEHHNAMEPHATTVEYHDGSLIIHDKTQGVQNSQAFIAGVFGLSSSKVRVVTPYLGGGFGSGLRPQYQVVLAVMASLALERSVRVVLTRDQTFTFTYRPQTINSLALGADPDGVLHALTHEAVQGTSQYEDHQEVVVNWSGAMYNTPNTTLTYKLAKLDTATPGDMRAPGAPLGLFAMESAMDELAYLTGVDPVQLRLRNYSEEDQTTNKAYSSKELRAAYQLGAERFGWSKRNPEPRSMREGRELIGWGMASGMWEAQMMKTSASAKLLPTGKLEVSCATSDIGTGTYTILTQIAAETLGLRMEDVVVRLGDSDLPKAPVEGGSWTAASAGSAVQMACMTVREKLFKRARGLADSPLGNADLDHAWFSGGRVAMRQDPSRYVTIADAMAGADPIEAEETASTSQISKLRYVGYTHSAVFVEVRVDEELGSVRVTRVVDAVAAGKILNPQTARSQVLGGVVFGIGMALEEESMADHGLGRFMNHNLAEYHIPVNADVPDVEVIFVDEHDEIISPIGVKGLGEIGIVGTAAAIANAIHHATGKRMRHLPITIDKVMA